MNKIDSVSVVIPAYNVEKWIKSTIEQTITSFQYAGISNYEIIVINDGSTDGTADTVSALSINNNRIVLINQENLGRLEARLTGIKSASYSTILLLDARVLTFPTAFLELNKCISEGNINEVWNGHVTIKYGWNLFARFWGVVTFVGWRKYLHKPRYVEFGLDEFDNYPKGTGFLLAPTKALIKAAKTFDTMMDDPRFASDDTGVLRNLAEDYKIAITPGFGCWYSYGRSSIKGFVKHTFDRGTFFVDSYFRKGTRFYWPLVAFILLSLIVIVALPVFPIPVLITLALLWAITVIVAGLLRAPILNVLAFAVVAPLFTLVFATGLWRGFYFIVRAKRRRVRDAT